MHPCSGSRERKTTHILTLILIAFTGFIGLTVAGEGSVFKINAGLYLDKNTIGTGAGVSTWLSENGVYQSVTQKYSLQINRPLVPHCGNDDVVGYGFPQLLSNLGGLVRVTEHYQRENHTITSEISISFAAADGLICTINSLLPSFGGTDGNLVINGRFQITGGQPPLSSITERHFPLDYDSFSYPSAWSSPVYFWVPVASLFNRRGETRHRAFSGRQISQNHMGRFLFYPEREDVSRIALAVQLRDKGKVSSEYWLFNRGRQGKVLHIQYLKPGEEGEPDAHVSGKPQYKPKRLDEVTSLEDGSQTPTNSLFSYSPAASPRTPVPPNQFSYLLSNTIPTVVCHWIVSGQNKYTRFLYHEACSRLLWIFSYGVVGGADVGP